MLKTLKRTESEFFMHKIDSWKKSKIISFNKTWKKCWWSFQFRFLPESVLWLMNKNKFDEAKKTLQKIAKFNGKTLTEEDLSFLQNQKDANETPIKYSFYHLVKTPAMRKRTFLMCYLWWDLCIWYHCLILLILHYC